MVAAIGNAAANVAVEINGKDNASAEINKAEGSVRRLANSAQLLSAVKIGALGQGFKSLGRGLMNIGTAGAGFLLDAASAAAEFEHSMRVASTQSAEGEAALDQIGDAVKRVAGQIPIDLSKADEALYDLFSSLNLTASEGTKAFGLISKAAVAGNVDVDKAAQGVIQTISIFKKDVADIPDILGKQFTTIKTGLGTYEHLSQAIGQAGGGTVKYGQSLDTLMASLSLGSKFLGNFHRAAIPVNRTFELLTRPGVAEGMRNTFGIDLTDAEGNFRDFGDILKELNTATADLSESDLSEKLSDVFGADMTRASRFLLPAIENADEFGRILNELSTNGSKNFEDAFENMMNSTENKIKLLNNRWDLFKINLGEAAIEIGFEFADSISSVLLELSKIDEEAMKAVVAVGLIGIVFAMIVGIIFLAVGGLLIFISLLMISGVGWVLIAVGIILVVGVMAVVLSLMGNMVSRTGDLKSAFEGIPRIVERFGIAASRSFDVYKRTGSVRDGLLKLKETHAALANTIAVVRFVVELLIGVFQSLIDVIGILIGIVAILISGIFYLGVIVLEVVERILGAFEKLLQGLAGIKGALQSIPGIGKIFGDKNDPNTFSKAADALKTAKEEVSKFGTAVNDATYTVAGFGVDTISDRAVRIGRNFHEIGSAFGQMTDILSAEVPPLDIETGHVLGNIDVVVTAWNDGAATSFAKPHELHAETTQALNKIEELNHTLLTVSEGKYMMVLDADGQPAIMQVQATSEILNGDFAGATYKAVLDADNNQVIHKGAAAQGILDGLNSTIALPSVDLDTGHFDNKSNATRADVLGISNLTGVPKVDGDTSAWQNDLGLTEEQIEQLGGREAIADILGDPAQLEEAVKNSNVSLDNIENTIVTADIKANNTDALNKITEVKTAIASIKGKTIGIHTNYTSSGDKPGSGQHGGFTGSGGLFLLHPDEFIMSKAMREGRRPLPATAFTGGAGQGGGEGDYNFNITVNGATDPADIAEQAYWRWKTRVKR